MISVLEVKEEVKKTAKRLAWLRGFTSMRSKGGRFLAGVSKTGGVFKMVDMGGSWALDNPIFKRFKILSATQKQRFVVFEQARRFADDEGIKRLLGGIPDPVTGQGSVFKISDLVNVFSGMPGEFVKIEEGSHFRNHGEKSLAIISDAGAVALISPFVNGTMGSKDDLFKDVDLTFEG